MNEMGAGNALESQREKMLESRIELLVLENSIPTMVNMVMNAIYNAIDTFFVAKLGTASAGAVGIVLSMMTMITALCNTFGMGSCTVISRKLGEGQAREASVTAIHALAGILCMGGMVFLLGLALPGPIMKLLGSTDTILPYAVSYGRIIMVGAPITMGVSFFQFMLRAIGRSGDMLPATVLGGVLNIPLDLLFIVKMHMGVAGAAYATILSQAVTLALLMLVFATKNDLLTLSVRNLSHEWEPYREILRSGMPTLCRQGFACSSNILMNYAARGFGDIAVAAITIVGKLFLIVQWLSLGYFQGVQPILGFNFGAKKYGRVKDTYLFALISASLTLAGVGIFSFLFAPQIVSLFATGDHEVLEIAAQTFRYQCITMPFLPFVLVCNMAFQACGKNKWSSITSSARQGIFFIPAVLLLPEMFGLKGLELVQATADMCAFCLSFYFVGKFVKELNVLIASAGEERDR